tara:strand:+ start:688 stop:1467 length:780 start_codon:yes stop_codon:yes gene_type:complete
MNKKHLLFIPVYNCEKQIIRVIAKLKQSEVLKFFEKVLIIDNGSSDNTISVVKKNILNSDLNKFQLVKNDKNYNLGGTHKSAFNFAIKNDYDYVSILHGDDQGDINDLKKIFNNKIYSEFDCILGSRFNKKSRLVNYPKFRIYANLTINIVASIVTLKWLTDLGSGINMFKVEYLKNQFYLNFPNDLTFNYSLIFYICHSKAKFMFFPITWREDDQISNVKLFSHAYSWLKILMKFIFNKKSLFNNSEFKKEKYFFNEV